MQNKVPTPVMGLGVGPEAPGEARSAVESVVDRAIDRSLQGSRAAVADEVRRLVEAALALVKRTGELEPRVSDIVKEAGLHNQAFYRHFRSKRELLVAVLDEGDRILASYLHHRMDAVSDPREKVREWIRGILEQALHVEGAAATRPFVMARGRLAESFPAEVAQSEQRLVEILRGPLDEGRAAGVFPHADPQRDAEALYLLAMGWVQARLVSSAPVSREDARVLEAFAMAGLERGPA